MLSSQDVHHCLFNLLQKRLHFLLHWEICNKLLTLLTRAISQFLEPCGCFLSGGDIDAAAWHFFDAILRAKNVWSPVSLNAVGIKQQYAFCSQFQASFQTALCPKKPLCMASFQGQASRACSGFLLGFLPLLWCFTASCPPTPNTMSRLLDLHSVPRPKVF